MEIVDAQIHLWTGDSAPPHHRQVPFRIEDALREMDAAGVERAVNCPAIWDAGANAYAVEAAEQYPDRFATLGWFDLDVEPDDAFVDRFVAQPGMLGLRFVILSPGRQERFADGGLDWVWAAADRLALPIGLVLPARHYGALAGIATRYPRIRFLVDHLGAPPFTTVPAAIADLDALLALATRRNIAVKATGLPSIASDDYPFASVRPALRAVLGRFGAARTFWGTDITRLSCTWEQCITMITEEFDDLVGPDLELFMGGAVRSWIGWA